MNKQEIKHHIARRFDPTECPEDQLDALDDILTIIYLEKIPVHQDVIIEISLRRKQLMMIIGSGTVRECYDTKLC